MFCPDCGQQQISDEIRFCSRCGLPLSAVSEVVANGGEIPKSQKKAGLINRRTGFFVGIVWILFFLTVVAPLLRILHAPGEMVTLAATLGFFSGAMILMSSMLFLNNPGSRGKGDYKMPRARFQESSEANALPPQQSIPVENYASPASPGRWKTNDLVQPSVTENTTKLLDNE